MFDDFVYAVAMVAAAIVVSVFVVSMAMEAALREAGPVPVMVSGRAVR